MSELPPDDTPYWLRGEQPLAGFRSQAGASRARWTCS